MKEYVSTIIYICIFMVILEMILPDNKLKKYVWVLVSLIIIITLINPIVNVLKNDNVIEAISTGIENIQGKVHIKEYDFNNLQSTMISTSVKKKLEDEIYSKCKERFDLKYGINKVKIILSEDYTIEDIDIYVKQLQEIASAAEIIDYIEKEYNIDNGVVNVIREE